MFDSFTFWLIVLAVLITYLRLSVERRLRAEDARFEEERRQVRERHSLGAATDFSTMAPRLQHLR
jgi:hypothetical protein